jgi:hypothetical protein
MSRAGHPDYQRTCIGAGQRHVAAMGSRPLPRKSEPESMPLEIDDISDDGFDFAAARAAILADVTASLNANLPSGGDDADDDTDSDAGIQQSAIRHSLTERAVLQTRNIPVSPEVAARILPDDVRARMKTEAEATFRETLSRTSLGELMRLHGQQKLIRAVVAAVPKWADYTEEQKRLYRKAFPSCSNPTFLCEVN